MTTFRFPKRRPGRPSREDAAEYDAAVEHLVAAILEMRSSVDFDVSARGWGYLLEGDNIIDKGDLDAAEAAINDCRKDGRLPFDICAVDQSRAFECVEEIDYGTYQDHAARIAQQALEAHSYYHPYSFWWFQPKYYLQSVVEKIDLKSLFNPVSAKYHLPIANGKGWSDMNMRAAMMRRFQKANENGKTGVLLYCGDFDVVGLQIPEHLRDNMRDLSKAIGWDPGGEPGAKDEGLLPNGQPKLIIDRFGLIYDFIEANGLTWIDNLITGSGRDLADPRNPDHWKAPVQAYIKKYGVRKVEANALVKRPEEGRALYEQAILKYVDEEAIEHFRECTEMQRRKVENLVRKLMSEVKWEADEE